MPQVEYPPSEKQMSYLESLMRDKEGAEDYQEDFNSITNNKQASELIGKLRALEYKPRTHVTKDGMYRDPVSDDIFKVQRNKAQGDGSHLYAKRLFIDHVGPGVKLNFVYEQGLLSKINPEWRMTLAEAEAFGKLYGKCVRCGRDLTKEESIARSLGPICVNYFDD